MNHHHSTPELPLDWYDGNLIEATRRLKRKFSEEFEKRHRLRKAVDELYALREEHGLEYEPRSEPEDDGPIINEEACEGDSHRSRKLKNKLKDEAADDVRCRVDSILCRILGAIGVSDFFDATDLSFVALAATDQADCQLL